MCTHLRNKIIFFSMIKGKPCHSRVCVEGIVSCHAFRWKAFFTVGAAVGGSRGQVFTFDVRGWVLAAGPVQRQTPPFAHWRIRICFVHSWYLWLCPRGDQAAVHLLFHMTFDFVGVLWEGSSGTGPGRPGQTGTHLSLVTCPGAPPCGHCERGVIVVESVRRLHGQGLDAIRYQGAGVVSLVWCEIELAAGTRAISSLLHGGDKPPLRGSVFGLRREEAAGLWHGPLTVVEVVVGEVVDELVLEEGLHGVAAARDNLVGAGGVGWGGGEAVMLWGCVDPEMGGGGDGR